MALMVSGVVGALVFGLLVLVLVWREQKKQKLPETDGCEQGHQCQCRTRSILQQQRKRRCIVNKPQGPDPFGNVEHQA